MKMAQFRFQGTVHAGLLEGSVLHRVRRSLANVLAPFSADCRGVLGAGISYVKHQTA